MSGRFPTWLKKQIALVPRRRPLSPLEQKIAKVVRFALLALVCLFLLWRAALYWEVRKQFTRIREAGLPASGAELNAWVPAVPNSANGVLVLTQAFALLRTFPDNRSNAITQMLLTRTNRWSPEDRGLIADYVRMNAPALSEAAKVTRFTEFRYFTDYTCGPGANLNHLSGLKGLSLLYAMQAGLDADAGRADEWAEAVELQLLLAATLEGQPLAYPHLTRDSLLTLAVKTTERSLNRAIPGPEASARLQAAFVRAGATNLLPLALIGERASLVPIFRMSWAEIERSSRDAESSDRPQSPQRYAGKPNPFLWLSGFLERDLNFFLRTMDKSIALAELPPPNNLVLTNYAETVRVAAREKHYWLAGMLLPSLQSIVQRDDSTLAQTEAAATALAVERFRLARGRLPYPLDELVPQFLGKIPNDPFDGARLRYRRLEEGYVIYSVGADRHDDGGREPPERKKPKDTTSYDITFVVGK